MDLTPSQRALAERPFDSKTFLRGPAGCGKTTVGVTRSLHLLTSGLPAESVLILTPQRTLQAPYEEAILAAGYAGGQVTFATIGGLARRLCDLFWPLVAEAAGFERPDQPPAFLTLETAQYYMAHLVRPKLDEGLFDSVTMDRTRLYSQILDNLNKAALVGFDYRTIGERLTAAWTGDPAQRRVYADTQTCANLFRDYCLANNLLDFSLQMEIFANQLWREPMVHDYLTRTYRHLIYDNVEEDAPRAHDILREWMADFQSALLIYDEGGGFRQFLGADPQTGESLRQLCEEDARLNESFVMSAEVAELEARLREAIQPALTPVPSPENRERG
ncbi:MAG: UvrD-helicase domain-containing protein, partial [Chloroflexota bacterium]